MEPQPPVARKIAHETRIHGITLTDNYFWMRDKSDAEVTAYLEAENAYTEAVMQPFKPLQEQLYTEMLGRIKQTDLGVPSRLGEYWYYSRTEEGKQYPYMCRRRGTMEAPEEILLDLNALAEGHHYLGIGAYSVSDDGAKLAFSIDTSGYRQFTLQVKDLESGAMLPDRVERVGSVVWSSDNATVFFTTEDAISKRSDRLWRHRVGADGPDHLVFEERDDLFDLAVGRSLDRRILFLGAYAKTSREIRYLAADTPTGEFTVVSPREQAHEYDVDHYQGQFYITTNKGAKNFKVVTAPIDDPAEKNWNVFIPHNLAVKIEGLSFFKNHLVVSERERGLSHLRVIDMRAKTSHRIAADEPDFAMTLSVNPEFDTTTIRYSYQSMVTPSSIYDYDMDSRELTLLKRQDVLGGYDPSNYEAQRLWVPARDGTQVPVSLVYREGTRLDGTVPMLLYAYGSYGISMAPTFSSARLSLLDRGVIYAIAYIRGGGELGEEWREQGRMMQKMNTFHDFIDCAEYLIEHRYTSAERLVIQGGSAGGLLVGAAVNMRPALFKAAVAQVPFLDVVNTMLDASLPLTTSEYMEWGNPSDKVAFDYIRSYSPYDNVTAQHYPSILLQGSLNDSQVPYWEAAKFAARLREVKTDSHPLLLKTNMGAGHGGASGRYDALREAAFTYAFVLWQMGKN
ncbi:MAG: S9 family peptidase [Vicinamibacterales bacterium]